MFHPDYNPIIAKLPKSLVQRAYHRLLYHSRSPVTSEQKYDRIEAYLYHTLEVYKKGLNRKRKKQIKTIEPLENLSRIYNAEMTNKESQTQDIVPICTCDHQEEINRRVKKEVDVLFQQLLKFMSEITSDYEERVKANKK